jgi:hypothetical protein
MITDIFLITVEYFQRVYLNYLATEPLPIHIPIIRINGKNPRFEIYLAVPTSALPPLD